MRKGSETDDPLKQLKGMYDIKWGAGVKMKFDATVGYE
jgi:hypothetical protein